MESKPELEENKPEFFMKTCGMPIDGCKITKFIVNGKKSELILSKEVQEWCKNKGIDFKANVTDKYSGCGEVLEILFSRFKIEDEFHTKEFDDSKDYFSTLLEAKMKQVPLYTTLIYNITAILYKGVNKDGNMVRFSHDYGDNFILK